MMDDPYKAYRSNYHQLQCPLYTRGMAYRRKRNSWDHNLYMYGFSPKGGKESMKAVRVHSFGGPEVLQFDTNVPLPDVGVEDVLIQVKAVGVNPVETFVRAGADSNLPACPFILGFDCAGVVEYTGAHINNFKPGDRVFTSRTTTGAYAEFTSAPARFVHPLPDSLTYAQGAALAIPYLAAYRALIHRGKGRAGEKVLVHGASGGVGIATVQLARAYGMTVFGTAGTPEGRELVSTAGAQFVFNHHDPAYLDGIKDTCRDSGINLVIEMAANKHLGQDIPLLAKRGRVVIVGGRGNVDVNPRDVMSREADLLGLRLFQSSEDELHEAHAAIQAGIEAGWLRPVVGKEYALEQAAEAHYNLIYGRGAIGKMVLIV